jgi:hypothetical protein
LSTDQFREKLPQLLRRGFPPPDPTTGNYYLRAIDQWMASRSALTSGVGALNDADLINERIKQL